MAVSVWRCGALLWRGARLLQRRGLGLGPGQGQGQGPVRRAGGGAHIEPQYRQYPELTNSQVLQSEILSGFMWFWIFWHMWHDPDAVTGHFPYPDPSKWTDEELGIPAIDEE